MKYDIDKNNDGNISKKNLKSFKKFDKNTRKTQ